MTTLTVAERVDRDQDVADVSLEGSGISTTLLTHAGNLIDVHISRHSQIASLNYR